MDPKANVLPTTQGRVRNPRKYTGYPIFARWTASDQDFFVIRRFETASVRVALALQDRITILEEQLNKLDDYTSSPETHPGIDNGSYRKEKLERRKEIIQNDLPVKLREYFDFVDAYSRFHGHPQPRPGIIRMIQGWFFTNRVLFNYGNPDTTPEMVCAIDEQESAYIHYTKDLISVHQKKDRSPFSLFVESAILNIPMLRVWPFVREHPERHIIDPEGRTVYQNDRNIDILSWILFTILTLAMLTGSLWILDNVSRSSQRLGIMTGFVGTFFVLVALATTAKIFGAIGATAAYAAILMVFLTLGATK